MRLSPAVARDAGGPSPGPKRYGVFPRLIQQARAALSTAPPVEAVALALAEAWQVEASFWRARGDCSRVVPPVKAGRGRGADGADCARDDRGGLAAALATAAPDRARSLARARRATHPTPVTHAALISAPKTQTP